MPHKDQTKEELLKEVQKKLEESELRYRRLFETAQDGILLLDFDTGMITDVNPFLVKLLGFSKEELLGKHLWEVGAFNDIAASKENFAELQKKGYVRYEDLPLQTKDGRHIEVEFVSNSYLVNNHKVIQCNIRNITEHRKAEEEIKSLNLRYQSMLAAIPDIIMEVNNDKIYTWANDAGVEFFGDDVIGHEASYYFEGEQKTYEVVDPIFKGREDVIYVESWQRRKDGERRLLAWWCRTLKDNDGKVRGAISTARDITENQKIEEELKKKVKEMEWFEKMTLGREDRIIELKEEIKKLKGS